MQTAAELSRMCDDHARRDAERSREVVAVGPFRALLDPSNELIWLNYAVPVEPIDDEPAAMAALQKLERAFAERDRTPRFEFNALPWPELPPLLERAGFVLQVRHQVMTCGPEQFAPVSAPGVSVVLLHAASSDDELRGYLRMLRLGFDNDASDVPDIAVAGLRRRLDDTQNVYALASLDGIPAGAGSSSPIEGVAELTGVATHPDLRRRGVAASLSSFLVAHHFAHGGRIVWLSAGDEIARATYTKVGFELIDERLNYIKDVAT
jgi:ribosomal protein S18 acetylase RimI-like enzyme